MIYTVQLLNLLQDGCDSSVCTLSNGLGILHSSLQKHHLSKRFSLLSHHSLTSFLWQVCKLMMTETNLPTMLRVKKQIHRFLSYKRLYMSMTCHIHHFAALCHVQSVCTYVLTRFQHSIIWLSSESKGDCAFSPWKPVERPSFISHCSATWPVGSTIYILLQKKKNTKFDFLRHWMRKVQKSETREDKIAS